MSATLKPRLLVLLSGTGRTMVNLVDASRRGVMRAEVAGVVASRPCAGEERARALGLATRVLRGDIAPEALARVMDDCGADLVCLAGYLRLLPIGPAVAGDAAAGRLPRVVNVHPALLPAFGGAGMHGRHVHEAVLAAGCRVSGCTVHFCDAAYDTGAILVQRACAVEPDDTPASLAARVFEQECAAYPEAINLLADGRVSADAASGGRRVRIAPARSPARGFVRGAGLMATLAAMGVLMVAVGAGAGAWRTARAAPPTAPPPAATGSGAEPGALGGEGPGLQEPEPESKAARDAAERAFVEAFNAGRMPEAGAALEAWIALRPNDWIPRYNLAIVRGRQGRMADADGALRDALARGFTDFRVLERDGDAGVLAATATARQILADWPRLQDEAIQRRVELAQRGFAKSYVYPRDEALRLAFASGFAASSFDEARGEMRAIEAWWSAHVLPEGEASTIARGERTDPWVMVILPTRADFTRWATRNYGEAARQIGGVYDNDKKELVARDLGATMRHEFLHILHWRHMNRLGQVHPLWVQEGLCSLVEDVHYAEDGSIEPVASWRTNSVKRLLATGRLGPLEGLLAMDDGRFASTRPLANYALARALFLFLHERGTLRAFYGRYTAGFGEDRTGRAALEAAMARPLAEIEREFRAWLAALPEVAEEDRPPRTALPARVGGGAGEGVVIRGADRGVALRAGDVITALGGQPVRDLGEFHRVLGGLAVGERVRVDYRRGKVTGSVEVTLVRRRGE